MIGAKTIVEIGVAYGYHAENLLGGLNEIAYHGIDPYMAGYDPTDTLPRDVSHLFNEANPQHAMERLYAAVKRNLETYGSRAKLHRKTSLEAAPTFNDGACDLIFVDGDHTYHAVKADLAAWWPKLKVGGVICGDDYVRPEIRRAAVEFALKKRLEVEFVSKTGANYPIWLLHKSN